MYEIDIKNRVIQLRKDSKTYGEIRDILGINIPKSTLSFWCSGILLSQLQKKNLYFNMIRKSENGRRAALLVNKIKRENYLKSIDKRIQHLSNIINNKNIAKIVAATLYLSEGAKFRKGSLSFGNSDSGIVKLFLHLLRNAYNIDENKFRCTVQCRADQDIKELEKFWAEATKILPKQFYKSRVDPRTIGKKTKKLDYKGVCRIEYFSADLFIELLKIGELLCKTGL